MAVCARGEARKDQEAGIILVGAIHGYISIECSSELSNSVDWIYEDIGSAQESSKTMLWPSQ